MCPTYIHPKFKSVETYSSCIFSIGQARILHHKRDCSLCSTPIKGKSLQLCFGLCLLSPFKKFYPKIIFLFSLRFNFFLKHASMFYPKTNKQGPLFICTWPNYCSYILTLFSKISQKCCQYLVPPADWTEEKQTRTEVNRKYPNQSTER